MGKFIDITGEIFNSWTVISFHSRIGTNTMWLCKCSCGIERLVRSYALRGNTSKSCGCKKYIRGDKGDSGFTILYNIYKARANSRNLEFALSKEEFKRLSQSNCFYCGVPPLRIQKAIYKSSIKYIEHTNYNYNGIDRVDNTKGYTIDNSVACCEVCNKAKRDLSLSDFYNWIDKISKFQENKKEKIKYQVKEELIINN